MAEPQQPDIHAEHRPDVAVIIVNYNTPALTVDCLQSLWPQRQGGRRFVVLVVDNASTDGSVPMLEDVVRHHGWSGWVRILPQGSNGGFARGNNAAIRHLAAGGYPPRYVWLLNPDTRACPGALEALAGFLDANPQAGIAGGSTEDAHGVMQAAAHRFPSPLGELEGAARLGPLTRLLARWRVSAPPARAAHRCDWVCGASMMVRWEIFVDVGRFDEQYFLYFEEVDFCRRAGRAGWQVWHIPASRIIHLEGCATGINRPVRRSTHWFESRRRYFVTNHGRACAALADLACVAGLLLCRLRRRLQRRPDTDPPALLRDILLHSLSHPLGWRTRHGARRPAWKRPEDLRTGRQGNLF